MKKTNAPDFHIPVMGIGFTIDTPTKVAQYGISSVISLVDDKLMEKLRAFYSKNLEIPYKEISERVEDFRAKRITAYLDLMNDIVSTKYNEMKQSLLEKSDEIEKYLDMLPDYSEIKQKFYELSNNNKLSEFKTWLIEHLPKGNIDVNIMTKLDKENYKRGEKLPSEYNDAHAALRGFANSKLHSTIILSAGMNPRLYSYIEQFKDFYPDKSGIINKKIAIKVSDYRSALIQGKFFAKKGLWVSEYRIESGLNCGGHAFATNGYLMGVILEEFKNNRQNLQNELHDIYVKALSEKGLTVPENPVETLITAQGGVGTAEEHKFLIDYYGLDSVGWGTPFLLVPEIVNMDKKTERILKNAKEKDVYLSNMSPLGVPFNTIRSNTKDIQKFQMIEQGVYGSPCSNRYLTFNTEHTDKPICTASRAYQKKCIESLNKQELSQEEFDKAVAKLTEKSCICVGLGTSALLSKDIDPGKEGDGVSVCPSPTIGHFSETYSLSNMVKHIYGKLNLISTDDRPNMFVKELSMYVDYLKSSLSEIQNPLNNRQMKKWVDFKNNLDEGINYYKGLFASAKDKFTDKGNKILKDLEKWENDLRSIKFPELK